METHLPDPPKPFRLLDLPAELRIRIYEHALTAPDKAIRIYYSYQRDRVNPGLVLPLLRTCRQINAEAQDVLYQENAIFAPANCQLIASPIIGSGQLPPPALARLRRVFVVLDASGCFPLIHQRIDFRPFQAMVRLGCLRIAIMAHPSHIDNSTDRWTSILSYIVERVPACCKLEYGARTDEEKSYATRFCSHFQGATITEVPPDTILRAAGYCQAEQGSKSGTGNDWRESDGELTFEEVRTW